MKDLSFLTKNPIAHRGCHNKENQIYENTIEAFKQAVLNNYIIELDVHLLKDGKIIVFHDDNLKRLTGIDKKVKECTLEEIKKYKINNIAEIPSLEEVLKIVDGKVPIIIELKYDNKVGPLESSLACILDKYKGLFAIKSFNPFSVRWFYKYRKDYIRGQLINKKGKVPYKWLVYFFITNISVKPDFISCDYKLLDKKRIQKFRKKGLVLTWTIKNKKCFNHVKNNADNYICENIDQIL